MFGKIFLNIYVTAFTLLSCSISLLGQTTIPLPSNEIRFKSIDQKDGLSSQIVDYAVKDTMGYMWFAHNRGLDRYDGTSFKSYPMPMRSPSDFMINDQKLYKDLEGNLWVTSNKTGNLKYDYKIDSFISTGYIKKPKCILQHSNRKFYIGTVDNGLYQIDNTKNDTLKVLHFERSGKINLLRQYKKDVFATTNKGFFKIDTNHRVKKIPATNGVDSLYSAIAVSKKHSIWVSAGQFGLYQYNEEEETLELFKGFENFPFKTDLYITYLQFIDDKLWVGAYSEGLFIIDFKEKTIDKYVSTKFNDTSIIGLNFASIEQDETGLVWVTTENGVSFYDPFLFQFNRLSNYDLPSDMEVSGVWSIDQDKEGNIWFGTHHNGIYKIDPEYRNLTSFTAENSGLASNRTPRIKFIKDRLWIFHETLQLQILDEDGNFETLNVNTNQENFVGLVYKIFEDSLGNIWFATFDQGLIRYDRNSEKLVRYIKDNETHPHIPPSYIGVITEDLDQNLWVGSSTHGLIKMDLNTEEVEDFPDVITGRTSIVHDPDGILWIAGLNSGIIKFDTQKKEKKYYPFDNQIISEGFFSMINDGNYLWAAGNLGIVRFEKTSGKYLYFNESDGLQDLEFWPDVVYKDSTINRIYFGGSEGINWIDPHKIEIDQSKTKTVLSNIDINGESIPIEDNQSFSHKSNTFNFHFSALQFTAPELVSYKYRLINFDDNWSEPVQEKSIRYTNLPPGDYQFQVISNNHDGIWSDTPTTYDFTIKKPWYATNLAIFIYALIVLSIGYGIFQYYKARWQLQADLEEEHREAERLKELDELKNRLYTNISHEFRTPLTLISGPIERQLQDPEIEPSCAEDLNLVQRSAKRLLHLVDQLLDLSKLETGNLEIAVSKIDLTPFLKQIVSTFKFQAQQHNLDLDATIEVMNQGWADPDVLEKITTNLLSNAVKYTPSGGYIKLNAECNDGFLVLTIINNGVSLKSEDLPNLFERYYQTSKTNTGAGIGLSLVKELAVVSHGSVIANLCGNDEIQFTVTLPILRSAYKSNEISEKEMTLESESIDALKEIATNEDAISKNKNMILVVEDDNDVRCFIKSIFSEDYTVKLAENGEQGYQMATKSIPDLIISDVMMPKLNGVQMTNQLKENELTSHIPIILLTAKSGNTNEISGLKSGADDYITKPFNIEKLRLKVKNLLTLRQNLQNRYSQDFKLRDLPCSNLDELFLERLQKTLDDCITDPSLTAELLAEKMVMSRTQLHRKLKALSGKSTTEFIRNQRNLLAKHLLENSDDSISEIAYKVGFNSPSYFIRCFKKDFKTSPTSFKASV